MVAVIIVDGAALIEGEDSPADHAVEFRQAQVHETDLRCEERATYTLSESLHQAPLLHISS